MHVYVGDVDWFVASSPEDAAACALETYGGPSGYPDGYDAPGHWKPLPDEKPLSIMEVEGEPSSRVTKTCGEWARENGRGFLCTTEW